MEISVSVWSYSRFRKTMKSVTLFIITIIDNEDTVIGSYTCYHQEDAPAPDASEPNNMTSIMKQMDRTKAAVRGG